MTKLGKILTYTFLDAIFIVDSDSEVYLRPNARLCALSNTNGISLVTQTNGPRNHVELRFIEGSTNRSSTTLVRTRDLAELRS